MTRVTAKLAMTVMRNAFIVETFIPYLPRDGSLVPRVYGGHTIHVPELTTKTARPH